jgi:ectoine hydroxylase-related dioxygenase (phytanoyl-CoA dioxygenase family)
LLFNFDRDGVEIRKALLSADTIDLIKSDIDLANTRLQPYGIRNLEKRFDSVSRLVGNDDVLAVARSLLNDNVSLVRALFFDKTPDRNWFVTWHQDKTVALNERRDLKGWGPWSIKDGVHHVQAPVCVLNKMITLRLHIDSAGKDNGCLRVIPGSHRHGILKQREIDEIVRTSTAVPCVVEAGDAVIMRPHLLHSSGKAERPHHRRVVHLEFSSFAPPDGTAWA